VRVAIALTMMLLKIILLLCARLSIFAILQAALIAHAAAACIFGEIVGSLFLPRAFSVHHVSQDNLPANRKQKSRFLFLIFTLFFFCL
jgi:hypothetical protein